MLLKLFKMVFHHRPWGRETTFSSPKPPVSSDVPRDNRNVGYWHGPVVRGNAA
jgi:hypothetical protein